MVAKLSDRVEGTYKPYSLYYNGDAKITATIDGVTVTGALTAGQGTFTGTTRANRYRVTTTTGAAGTVAYGLNNSDNTGMYYRVVDGYNQIAFSVDNNYIATFGYDPSTGGKIFGVGSSVNPIGNREIGAVLTDNAINIFCGTNTFGAGLWGRSNNGFLHIFYRNGSVVGSIAVNGSSTSYNTSSDYRLKENLQPITNPLDTVMLLNPVNFAWKESGERVNGFIAHELGEQIPEAVTGEKDAVDEDGKPVYQGIDQSKLVPLLTAALQEAITKIEDLTARIEVLEG